MKSKNKATLEAVQLYLQMETNYALLIKGDWGIGKTHYFKNEIMPFIEEQPVFSDNRKKYKPIIVSLFGLKSIEEIQTEVFLVLHSILKTKAAKVIGIVGKTLFKQTTFLSGMLGGFSGEDITELWKAVETQVKLEKLVICFDDLERISEELKINDLIGYVNSLVESKNIKVIIISNDDKIKPESHHEIKEKVIGNSVEFIQDYETVFENIIKDRFNTKEPYYTFLRNKKDFIINYFLSFSKNLRTLIFMLSYFQFIFSEIEKNILEENVLFKLKSKTLERLLKFTIAVSIEYKNGNLSLNNKAGIDNNLGDFLNFTNKDFSKTQTNDIVEQTSNNLFEKFQEQYFQNERYHFFESVFDFITGGGALNTDSLINELGELYNIKKGKMSDAYKLFNSLLPFEVLKLEDSQYIKKTKELLFFVDEGAYDLKDYMAIYFYSIRFGNPLELDPQVVVERIIVGARKGVNHYKYNQFLERDLDLSLRANCEGKEDLMKIKRSLLEINEGVLESREKSIARKYEELIYKNINDLIDMQDDIESAFNQKPVLQYFDATKLSDFFIASPNKTKLDIILVFRRRYLNWNSFPFKEEKLFIETLKEEIENKKPNMGKQGPTSELFLEMNEVLKGAIKKIDER